MFNPAMNDKDRILQLGGPTKVCELLGFQKRGGAQRIQNWMTRGIPAKVKVEYPEIFLVPVESAEAREAEPKAYPAIPSMDWKNGIADLLAKGRTVKDIAAETGLSVTAVYDLKNGYSIEPRGMAAVRLHEMITGGGAAQSSIKEAA